MRDTIYRDEAIKAIKDNSFALGDDYMEINGYGAIDDIRALPSADRPQGEWIDAIRNAFCEDCRGYRYDICEYRYTCKSMLVLDKVKGADNEH